MAQDSIESATEQFVRAKKKRIAQAAFQSWESVKPNNVPRGFVEFYCYVARKMGYAGEDGKVTFPVYLVGMMELIIHQKIHLPSQLEAEKQRLVLLQGNIPSSLPLIDVDPERNQNGKKAVIDIAPRHLKTSSALIALQWVCYWKSGTKSLYASYSDEIVRLASNQFATMSEALGFNSMNLGTVTERHVNGNTVFFKSVRGPITAIGVNWTSIVDDSLKGINDARSPIVRNQVWETIQTCVFTRFELSRVNSLIIGTRWHADDPQGKALKLGYKHISIPALITDSTGTVHALAPTLRSKEFLLARKLELGDTFFNVLYQGETASNKTGPFNDNVMYDDDPQIGSSEVVIAEAHGIDIAYSTSRNSDYSCWVHLVKLSSGKVLLKNFRMARSETVRQFFARCKAVGMPSDKKLYWYTGGQETLLGKEIGEMHGVRVETKKSLGKLGNSQNFSIGWNTGKFFVPASWRTTEDTSPESTVLSQIIGFTGCDDDNEDAVDAISAAYDVLVPRTGNGECPMPDMRLFNFKAQRR